MIILYFLLHHDDHSFLHNNFLLHDDDHSFPHDDFLLHDDAHLLHDNHDCFLDAIGDHL